MFSYVIERKKACDDDKILNFFKSKKCLFSKGVQARFQSKSLQFFLVCFLAK